jgi:uncharacterized membrane protein HdeD (DUF308 family)
MFGNLIRNWWTFVVQGALAIVVGLAAFLVPGPTLAAFIAVFAFYAIVTGAIDLVAGFSMQGGPKWSLVVGGVAGIAVGLLAIASPDTTAEAATLLVGVYAIVVGAGRMAAAYLLSGIRQTWLLGLSGILAVVFGVLLIADTSAGVLAVLWLIGTYAIFAGVSNVAFGLRLRGFGKDVKEFEEQLTGSETAGVTANGR